VSGWVSAPQDHSRVSNINFDFKTNEEGGSIDVVIFSWDINRAPLFICFKIKDDI
jgi:hypothetical protein